MGYQLATQTSRENENLPATSPDTPLVKALLSPDAYPDERPPTVEMCETHISRVFLTEKYAYKLKKPVHNDFVDYSTLEKRQRFCFEELRLDGRYAPDLYLGVVPVTTHGRSFQVGGSGRVVDYAVKMWRFPNNVLLSRRLDEGKVSANDIRDLAIEVAAFHRTATCICQESAWGHPPLIFQDALDNLEVLAPIGGQLDRELAQDLRALRHWTEDQYRALETAFKFRRQSGSIRECHGDLHAGNIVWWQDRWTPFDGIEFNERFRWIDVLSDAGFLAMDLFARAHTRLARLLVSHYLESTGDYEALPVLRWYMVYRALVRAKVAAIRLGQLHSDAESEATTSQMKHYLATAVQLTRKTQPRLWITHGLSGSGKSTGADRYVQQEGAIRLRSDVERKRLWGRGATTRPTEQEALQLYSTPMTQRTYDHLQRLAAQVIRAGHSVVVDATFLKQVDRASFARLASEVGATFQILDFQVPESELKKRITTRFSENRDVSDANLKVLTRQIRKQEPLTTAEREIAVSMG